MVLGFAYPPWNPLYWVYTGNIGFRVPIKGFRDQGLGWESSSKQTSNSMFTTSGLGFWARKRPAASYPTCL